MKRRRLVIMGAAGRDFHNFNVLYRNREDVEVVAFTAAQIPNIAGRRYPPALAGPLYPAGIPIVAEAELPSIVKQDHIDDVVLSYSDLPHIEVMHKASIAIAAGASFVLPGAKETMLLSSRPVWSVCAVRTGAGKSPLTRFASGDDLDRAQCTIEEREEYEPLLREGVVVYAGVDYERILRQAEAEAELVIWDGGNNDLPFFASDLQLVVVDPHRPGHELTYHPGEANFRMADVLVISKTDSATPEGIRRVEEDIALANPNAQVVRGGLRITADRPERLRGRRVLVVEDGPTVTHGGMSYGAGAILARMHGATVVDARESAVGSIREVYREYPHLDRILPAMGYTPDQVRDLEATIERSGAEFVVDGSPVDLKRLVRVTPEIVDVRYEYADIDGELEKRLAEALHRLSGASRSATAGEARAPA